MSSKIERMNVANDFFKYNLTVMIIQEAKVIVDGMLKFKCLVGKILHQHNSGNQLKLIYGIMVIVKPNCNVSFQPITHRICMTTTRKN